MITCTELIDKCAIGTNNFLQITLINSDTGEVLFKRMEKPVFLNLVDEDLRVSDYWLKPVRSYIEDNPSHTEHTVYEMCISAPLGEY